MRDRALFAGVVALAALGILVDSAVAILSVLYDAVMMGGAVGMVWAMLRSKERRIVTLEAELATARQALEAGRPPARLSI
jgi:Flp pilus assembly protein TadB